MSTVISVESLGKKYTISHQQRGDNSSLREVITNRISYFGEKMLTPFRRSLAPCKLSEVEACSLPHAPASEDFWALKDVSFEVKQGDRIGIIGRNGAGKSTLLKILSRITEPTIGRVRIKGRVASLLEVGTGFHPELTGRENIYLNGAILGMSRQEISKKFDEIVDFSEIEKFLDTPVKRYSSGMYVRLAFAVAAHLEPEILIVDEVLAVGDFGFRRKCQNKMQEVGGRGQTILFVSHDVAQINSLCTKAILLYVGKLVSQGEPQKITDYYIQEFSGIRLGENPHRRKILESNCGTQHYIKEVYLTNNCNNLANRFTSRDSFYLCLCLQIPPSFFQSFAAVWFIHNKEGVQIAVGASYPMDDILYDPTTSLIRCVINPESLVPGLYRIRVVLHVPHQQLLDSWDEAICFEVTENDATGSGYCYPGIWTANQYVRHRWISPNDNVAGI